MERYSTNFIHWYACIFVCSLSAGGVRTPSDRHVPPPLPLSLVASFLHYLLDFCHILIIPTMLCISIYTYQHKPRACKTSVLYSTPAVSLLLLTVFHHILPHWLAELNIATSKLLLLFSECVAKVVAMAIWTDITSKHHFANVASLRHFHKQVMCIAYIHNLKVI